MTAPQTDAPTVQERLRKITANPIYLSGVPGTTPGNVIAKEAADALDARDAVIADLVAVVKGAKEGDEQMYDNGSDWHERAATALAKAAALKGSSDE